MISYDEFLANVQPEHMQLLAAFTAGERVRLLASDTVAVTAMKDACGVLFGSGLVSRIAEGYELVGEVEWRTYDGYVVPAALGYCWQLARERLVLSREPLPPA